MVFLSTKAIDWSSEDALNGVRVDMQRQIDEAKAVALPKPFKVRLIAFLNALDKRIIPELAAGQTNFFGNFTLAQFAEIQKLAAESGASAYITFQPGDTMTMNSTGPVNTGKFELTSSLLEP
jgi:hypothetical protein